MKKILLYVLAGVMFLPCLPMIGEGRDGNLSIWNFVGFAYAVALVIFFKIVFHEKAKRSVKR